jgi:RNA polymerase sigma-70 factor (ECF subfamily)
LRATRPDEQPEAAAEAGAEAAALGDALQLLTPEQRACWVLRELHGCSYDEIAGITGASAGAVRGRIARSRAVLAEVMRPWR